MLKSLKLVLTTDLISKTLSKTYWLWDEGTRSTNMLTHFCVSGPQTLSLYIRPYTLPHFLSFMKCVEIQGALRWQHTCTILNCLINHELHLQTNQFDCNKKHEKSDLGSKDQNFYHEFVISSKLCLSLNWIGYFVLLLRTFLKLLFMKSRINFNPINVVLKNRIEYFFIDLPLGEVMVLQQLSMNVYLNNWSLYVCFTA